MGVLLGIGSLALGSGSAPPASAASVAGGRPVLLERSASPAPPPGSRRVGAPPPGERLHVDVTLRLPDPVALRSFIASVSDRRSPAFGRYLPKGEFGRVFGPPLSEVRAVDGVLEAAGLHPGPVSPSHLVVPLTATVSALEKAFHVRLADYRLPAGRVAFAATTPPELSSSVASYVDGVIGLDDLYRANSRAVWPGRGSPALAGPPEAVAAARGARTGAAAARGLSASAPTACPAAQRTASSYGSLTAGELASHYSMTGMYALGDLGQGVRIALAEFEHNSATDIAAYESCYGLSTPVSYERVDGGAGTGPGQGEAALDIEDVVGLAPKAAVDVYRAPNSAVGDVDLYQAIVDGDDPVVSSSWGMCEQESSASVLTSEQTLFEQAASQGETVFAASGDSGSTDCYPPSRKLAVDDPASQPYVVGVGGTTIHDGSESAWNSAFYGAGGGGASTLWCMPAYQDQTAIPGIVSSYSSKSSAQCGSTDPYMREVPDLSADADPATGYTIYWDGSWTPVGGTSGAAPLWAAVAALVDASPFCSSYGSGDPGVQPAGLYEAVAASASYVYSPPGGGHEALYDVTLGNNDYLGLSGGPYPATPGYDMASGLGTPIVSGRTPAGAESNFYPGLAALMCHQYATENTTAAISSAVLDTASSETDEVVVTGSGFLPVRGADRLSADGTAVPTSCRSTTRCTAVLPGPGPFDLVMRVEDLATSASYTYLPPPAVKIVVPRKRFSKAATLTLRYSSSEQYTTAASYDVRYRVALWDRGFGPYRYPASWQGTVSTSERLAAATGHEYCFSVRARDSAGNLSRWSPERCTARPLGSGALARITPGWTRGTGSAYYLGRYLRTSRYGAKLRIDGAELRHLALVFTRCPSCGDVAIYLNKKLWHVLDTKGSTTRHRVVLSEPPLALEKATITLEDVSRKGHVVLEGIGIARL